MIKFFRCLAMLLPVAAVTLAGCGGDDNGATPFQVPTISTTPVSITTVNDDAVANTAFIATEFTSGLSDSGTFAGFKSGTSGQTTLLSRVIQYANDSLNSVASSNGEPSRILLTSVTTSESDPCAISGTISISTNTSNVIQSYNDLTPGDRFTLSANACDDGVDTVNGSLTFTFNDGNILQDIGIVFNNFRVFDGFQTITIHGDFRMETTVPLDLLSSSDASVTISGSSFYLVESEGDALHMTGFTLTITTSNTNYTVDASMTIDSTLVDGRLVITVSGVSGSTLEQNPSSGTIDIVGNMSNLTITIGATDVQLGLDSDGDNIVDTTTPVAWTNFNT